jgi:FkbM family methyltransferase
MKKIILLVIVVLALTLKLFPSSRLCTWVLLGRNQSCPMSNALQSPTELREQVAKKDQIAAALKLIETDPKGFKLFDTPDGKYWIPSGSEFALPFHLAQQARGIYDRNNRGVRSGDVVLDGGANVGMYTRHSLNKGAKLVVAIEPAPENLECLRRNFAAEIAAGKVIVYPKGIWDKDDFLELYVNPANSGADSFVTHETGWGTVAKVPLTTIDKLVAELKLDRVDFIKLDIEGAETNALQGARTTLAQLKPRLAVSVDHAPDQPRTVPEHVRAGHQQYQMECGPCSELRFGVRPDILYFFP